MFRGGRARPQATDTAESMTGALSCVPLSQGLIGTAPWRPLSYAMHSAVSMSACRPHATTWAAAQQLSCLDPPLLRPAMMKQNHFKVTSAAQLTQLSLNECYTSARSCALLSSPSTSIHTHTHLRRGQSRKLSTTVLRPQIWPFTLARPPLPPMAQSLHSCTTRPMHTQTDTHTQCQAVSTVCYPEPQGVAATLPHNHRHTSPTPLKSACLSHTSLHSGPSGQARATLPLPTAVRCVHCRGGLLRACPAGETTPTPPPPQNAP